jgi:putative ABC transport system permease protein
MRLSSQDVRLAARSFARQPGFAVVAVLSLALAIALNTTMYSVLDAMIRPKLDMREPGQLYVVQLYSDLRLSSRVDARTRADLLRAAPVVEATTYQESGWEGTSAAYGDRYAEIHGASLVPNTLSVFGVKPLRGRAFTDADLYAETQPILISEQLAATLSPDKEFPLGESIDVGGSKHPVIGILSRTMVLPSRFGYDVFGLVSPPAYAREPVNIIRLKRGVTQVQADAALKGIAARFALLTGEDSKYVRYDLKRAAQPQFQPQRFHFAIAAAVIAVLLVACANLANLQLARGIGRARELAVRTALGATRSDIITQLLLESAIIASAGLALGVVLTFWGTHVLTASMPPSVAEYVIAPQISWRVFAFALIASVLCVLLIGLIPAIKVSRVDPNSLMKSGAGTGALKRNRRQYGYMVAVQIGLALALLSGASLVVRTAVAVHNVDLNYDAHRLATGSVYLRHPRDTVIRFTSFANQLMDHIRAMPDVEDAAVSMRRPMDHYALTVSERGGTLREVTSGGYAAVTPGYFRAMGLRVTKGRDFIDGAPATPEIIVDQHTASGLWPGVDPIGQMLKMGRMESRLPWARVVGVIPNVNDPQRMIRYNQMTRSSPVGEIYYLADRSDSVVAGPKRYNAAFNFIVRAKSDPERLPVTLRRYLKPEGVVAVARVQSMEDALGLTRERTRHDFVASVFLTFALMGVGLAALGIYGIVAHSVAERTRELGVLIALGATSRNILHAVLREGNVMALAGVAIGLYFTKNSAGWLHAFIFDEDEYNAPIFAAVALILFIVAVVSALGPALRATRIDPVESLRSE